MMTYVSYLLEAYLPKIMDIMTSMDTAFFQALLNLVILWLPLKIVESLLGQPTWNDMKPAIM